MIGSVAHLFNQTVTVERRQVTADGMGGQKVAWTTVGAVPCRVSVPAQLATAFTTAAQSTARIPYYVYLPVDADVRRGDLLVDETVPDLVRRLWVESVSWPSIPIGQRATIMGRADCRDYQTEPTVHAEPEPEPEPVPVP